MWFMWRCVMGVTGRRCEAKLALPRGGGNPSRTTRIFVARILPGVTDQAFREYFEQFGVVQVGPCCASLAQHLPGFHV